MRAPSPIIPRIFRTLWMSLGSTKQTSIRGAIMRASSQNAAAQVSDVEARIAP